MSSIAILEAVNTTAVQFHGQPIITAMVAGVAYVAMKPIVDNLGMSWTTQHRKLMQDMNKFNHPHKSMVESEGCGDSSTPSKFNCRDISMVAADGKLRQLLCIPLRKLNGWLFSINPERVRSDIRDKLIQYQEECFTVLHEYWTKGEAVNPRKAKQSTAKQLTPLRQTVERLIATGMGNIYGDIWKLVHNRYEIDTINQLQPAQIKEAVAYLDGLEGEFIGKQAIPAKSGFTDEEIQVLCWLWSYADYMRDYMQQVYPMLRAGEHRLAGAYCSMPQESPRTINAARRILLGATEHIDSGPARQDNWRVLYRMRHEHDIHPQIGE